MASQPEPIDPYISLSKDSLTASYDGTKQVTDKMTLNGDSRNYITLNLPKDVTFHNSNTGAKQTGGSVNVHGGTIFYFTAPTSVTTDWSTGEMYGSTSTAWKAIVVKTAESKQDIGSYYEESQRNSVRFSVDWLELARVGVYKVDSKVADAKLAGAVFGIYKDKACTQLITKMPKTDAKGYAEAEIVKTQDMVYLKEITAPKGYRRNTTAYNVKLIANETTTVTVPDVEQMAELPLRSRYYHSEMDNYQIKKGQPYDKLKKSIVIFICTFDFFGDDRSVYTFESVCLENAEIKLEDKRSTIFVNIGGNRKGLPEELKKLLDYFKTGIPTDAYTESLQEDVEKNRRDDEWRDNYMTFEMIMEEKKQEGETIGKIKGESYMLISQVIRKIQKGKSMEKTAEELEEDVTKIAPIYEAVKESAPEYDVEEIYRKVQERNRS